MSWLTETKQDNVAWGNSTARLPLIAAAVSRELLPSRSFHLWLRLKTPGSPFLPQDPRSPGKGFVFRHRPTSSASRKGIWRGRRPPLDRPAPWKRWSPSRSATSGGRPVCSRCNLRGGGWWENKETPGGRGRSGGESRLSTKALYCSVCSGIFSLRLFLPNERQLKERPEGGAAAAGSTNCVILLLVRTHFLTHTPQFCWKSRYDNHILGEKEPQFSQVSLFFLKVTLTL